MFKNNLKTAWRNLKFNRTFSLLNIVGLAVGIACASLIFLWVEYYVNFNDSMSSLDRLYNVKNTQVYGKDTYTFSSTAFKTKDALLAQVPGVAAATRFGSTNATVSLDGRHLSQPGAYVDSAFLGMFDFVMLAGDPRTALTHDTQLVISERLAQLYFGRGDALNQTLKIDGRVYQVSGIFSDRSGNVSFKNIDWLLPYHVFYAPHQGKPEDSWGNNWTNTWVLLSPDADVAAANAQVQNLIKRDWPETNNTLSLYPLKRMALYGVFENGMENPSLGQIRYVRMFSIIAIVILFIACINFMNLSTARSERRSREIGVRKVLGSGRNELVTKFLFESVIVAYLSVLLAVSLVAAVLPAFSSLIDIKLKMALFQPTHLAFLVGIGLFSGIVAGSYPSLYLSSFNPIATLKGNLSKEGAGATGVRKVLVVVQFSVSVIIMIAIVLIYQQIQHTQARDLGYSKDNVLYVGATQAVIDNPQPLRQKLMTTGAVRSVSLSSASPMAMHSNGGGFRWKGKDESENVLVTIVATDAHFNETFGVQLKEGQGFSHITAHDSANVIINESFARLMGAEGRVGAQISQGDGPQLTVIGITRDFVYNDLNSAKQAPLLFYNLPQYADKVYMRLDPAADLTPALHKLEAAFRQADPEAPFDYHFLDEDFENKFAQIRFVGSLAAIFGSLAIFISCLGLFGLSAFMVEKRIKEIGVRKVLGASVNGLTLLLSKDFLKLVGVSCAVAFPVAYWVMRNWLQDYPYRIEIGWGVFVLAGAVALAIAFLTVSFQTIRAALANPVASLRSE